MDANFWITISFIIFIVIFYRYVRSIIIRLLDNKIGEIKYELQKSDNFKEDANLALLDIKEKLNQIHIEKQAIKDHANMVANNILGSKLEELDTVVNHKYKQAEIMINNEKQKAINEIYNYFFDKSAFIATKYIENMEDRNDKDIIKNLSNYK